MEYTTTEINRQANRIRVQMEKYKSAQMGITGTLNNVKEIIKNKDSILYGSIANYISTYEALSNKLLPELDELATKMKKYVADTLENDNTATKRITELKDELSKYLTALATI